jgi:hypothetical protein
MAGHDRAPLAVYFFSLFGFAVAYRVRLAYNLYHPESMGPMGFLPEHSSKLDLAAGLLSDVQYAAAWALLTYLAWLIVRYLWPQSRDSRAIQAVFALASIMLYACIHLLHLGTIMYLHLAPGRDFIVYALRR